MSYVVKVGFDEIERRYFVLGSDIPGLNVETETFEEFVEVIRDVAPDLVGRHGRELTIKFQREAVQANGWAPISFERSRGARKR